MYDQAEAFTVCEEMYLRETIAMNIHEILLFLLTIIKKKIPFKVSGSDGT